MDASSRKQVTLKALICLAGVFLLAVTAPWMIATGWHLSHATTQVYENYRILVPGRFIMRRNANGIRLIRARAFASSRLYKLDSIEMSQGAGQLDTEAWKTEGLRTTVRDGFKDVKSFDTDFGGFSGACIERRQDDSYVPVVVYCKNSDNLAVQYFGDADGMSALQEVLGGMRSIVK